MDYSKLNKDSLVVDVIVVDDLIGSNEQCIQFLQELTGHLNWIVTSSPDLKNTGNIGNTYSQENKGFIEPQPFQSWSLNIESLCWEAPIAEPNNEGFAYWWNESTLSWIEEPITGE